MNRNNYSNRPLKQEEKVVLYGMGAYARMMLTEYCVTIDAVEVIIDRCPEKLKDIFKGAVNVILWDDFVKNRDKYFANKIIVCSPAYRDEITEQILKSGLFEENQVIFIDKWLHVSFKSGKKFSQLFYRNVRDRMLKGIPELKENALDGAILLSERTEALSRLPQNLVVAEVGVAYGDFSKKIFEIMRPDKFYAIDIFDESTKDFWGNDILEKSDMNRLEWYKRRFLKEIETGRFEIKRGLSWEVLAEFPDDYFDYVYLDAAHDYNSVSKDIEVLKRKVKNGGVLQFNDYINYDYYSLEANVDAHFYGIKQAVNQLISDTDSKVIFYCLSQSGFDDIVIRYQK